MRSILITGGAGFVGSQLALRWKESYDCRVVALDNLSRRGSELSIARLRSGGVDFVHGDIRSRGDLFKLRGIDLIIDCAAEPSVLAGREDPESVIQTNLLGTVNQLELARREQADFIFLSTSRIYPIVAINQLRMGERQSRWTLEAQQEIRGASEHGLSEEFPTEGVRSLYGGSKLAAEILLQEYRSIFGLRAIVNRCGVLTGPGQMGKVDQGFVSLWVARHIYGGPLAYIGYGGTGKQVRDVLHVDDLFRLLQLQIQKFDELDGIPFNVGGGVAGSTSLCELTELCREATGEKLEIEPVADERPDDLKLYISDHRRVTAATGWTPTTMPPQIVAEMASWIRDHHDELRPILAPGA